MQSCRPLALLTAVGLFLPLSAVNGQSAGSPRIDPAQARLDQTIAGLDGAGIAMAYNPELDLLAAASDRGTIQLWERDVLYGVRSGGRTPYLLHGNEGPLTALASRGNYLVSSATDMKLYLWSLPEGKTEKVAPWDNSVRSLAVAAGGRLLAAGREDGAIDLVEVPSLKLLGKLIGHADWVTALQFRADGRQLASGANDGQVIIWDVSVPSRLASFSARVPPAKDQPQAENSILALAWSRDGATLAVAGTDRRIHLYLAADGEYLRSMTGHTGAVTGVVFSADGSVLASSSKDRTVRLWRVSDSAMLKSLEGHTAWVEGADFVAHGTRLASIGADRTIRLWDLAAK